MHSQFPRSIRLAWITWAVVWLAAGLGTKKTARMQSTKSRLIQTGVLLAAFVLLVDKSLAVGPLAWRFVPINSAVAFVAVTLTIAGLALAI